MCSGFQCCFARHIVHLLDNISQHRRRRVQVSGVLHYRGLGDMREVEAIRVRFLRDCNELPSIDDILDPDFTGGMRSEDYLARLRDGDA